MSTIVPNGAVEGGYHRVDVDSIELVEGNFARPQEVEEEEFEEERPALIYAEQEIYNLLELRRLPETDFWKVAEEEWEKSAKQFGDRVEGKKKQVLDVFHEIYQLVGICGGFQGLLVTAASQGTWLSCSTKWWVLTLSLFASVVTAAGVRQKNVVISDLQKTIDSEDPTRKRYVRRLQRLKHHGPKEFDLRGITQREERCPTPESASCVTNLGRKLKKELCSYRWMMFLCLCAFGILSAVSIYKILCTDQSSCVVAAPVGSPA